ncbi:MAG: molybdopterin-dependent oxidoreductase [Adlercreutzia sp.]|nr:molybdopterin-dependent oxidoreductase [Adlercreutzia sp.]
MEKTTKKIAGVTGTLMLLSMGANAAVAFADDGISPDLQPAADEQVTGAEGSVVAKEKVAGAFSYTQSKVSSVADIVRAMGAAQYLCGGQASEVGEANAADWVIAVGGQVESPYAMTVAELQQDPDVQKTLIGCSCSGNPADGGASVNAMVRGVSVNVLMKKAAVSPDANTAVFISSDGYEVALPVSYLKSHQCPIVFDVNGSSIDEVMGGTNQLWLGSTSARYFARNIVSITFETRDEAPAAPGTPEAGDTYANLPNIGVDFGGTIG